MIFMKKYSVLIALVMIASLSIPSICIAGDRSSKNFKAIPGKDFYLEEKIVDTKFN